MSFLSSSIPGQDGHLIPLYHWPVDNPLAVVHILHGMSEHGRCYDDVAQTLQASGLAVIAHDHRCHGAACDIHQLGQASEQDSFRRICDDVLLVNRAIRGWYPQRPLLLLGHSMGSFIAQIFAQEHSSEIDALLLEGSNYAAPWYLGLAGLIAALETWRQGPQGQSALLHALSFGQFNRLFRPNRTRYDWLSRDPRFVDRYIADPLCGTQVSNLYWKQMLQAMVTMSRLSSMRAICKDLPIYVFSGEKDPVGGQGKGVKKLVEVLKSSGIRQVDMQLYPDARHDILHETHRDRVIADMVAWMYKVSPQGSRTTLTQSA